MLMNGSNCRYYLFRLTGYAVKHNCTLIKRVQLLCFIKY